MDATAGGSGPAVRRLCVATTGTDIPGPLTLIQRSGGFYRLYVKTDLSGAELAVASPGIDEVSLIADLIAAIHGQITPSAGPRQPTIAGFHVGITRLIDDSFGGTGVEKVLALIRHPAVLAACGHAEASSGLAVAVTAGLFEELRAEGLPHRGWKPLPAADAWLSLSDPTSALAPKSRRQ